MAEPELKLPHKLTLQDRSSLTMSGVTEVVTFDENTVILRTQLGTLVIQGQELQLKSLSPEGGQVSVTGKVCAMIYEEPRPASLWRRLFS